MKSAKNLRPIIFFHGFFGLPSDYRYEFLSRGEKKIHSPDYTNLPELSPEIYLSDWGSEFLKWADHNWGLDPLTAIGYSQGGRLLLSAFALQPERFDKLVLISSHPGLQSTQEREERLKSDRKWALNFREMEWSLLTQLWDSQSVFKQGPVPKRDPQNFDREKLALCLENWSLAHQPDYREVMASQSRIEVILGEDDEKYVQLYAALKVKIHKVKGAAHRVPLDQPIRLTETLNSILDSKTI